MATLDRSPLFRIPFSPLVTGAALFLLTRSPDSIRVPLLSQFSRILSQQNTQHLLTGLKWLFALGLLRNINALLNNLTSNNLIFRSATRDWSWPNEIAVITGTSSGFGRLFALDLMKRGVRAVGLDISPPPTDLSESARFTHITCDVTSSDAVQRAAAEIQSTVGHPSILINNAGIGGAHSILETPPAFLKKICEINLLSHYYTLQAFLPHMIAQDKGHVVSIASMASFVYAPGMIDYCITKSALVTLHKGLGAELRAIHRAPNVKTSIVHPTWASTALLADHEAKLREAKQVVIDPQIVSDAVVKQIISGRGGQILLTDLPGPLLSLMTNGPYWLYWLMTRVIEKSMATASA